MSIMDLFGPIAANDNVKRLCVSCGSHIVGRGNRKFCSKLCKSREKNRLKAELATKPVMIKAACAWCEADFDAFNRQNSSSYCSLPCRGKGERSAKKQPIKAANCGHCEVEFAPSKASQIFCSYTCKRKNYRSRKDKGKVAEENAKRVAKEPVRECEWCGDSFQSRNKGNEPRFCSKSCSTSHIFREHRIYEMMAGVRELPRATFVVYMPLCECCGRRFTAPSVTSRLCSEECRKVEYRAKALERCVANDNVDRSPRPCAECGTVFSTSYGDARTTYCSKQCSKRNARRTKRKKERARLRGVVAETVNPITVLERDGWRCQICGIDTPRELRGTYESNAPEMDHIKPLAKGGSHTYDNVQCACRQCNAAKSDRLPVAA